MIDKVLHEWLCEQIAADQTSTDPTVLAECEALRTVIAALDLTPSGTEPGGYDDRVTEWMLRSLAVHYADRLGYRDEWRP